MDTNQSNSNLPIGVHAVSSSEDDEDFKDFEEAEQFPIEDEATQVSTVASTHKQFMPLNNTASAAQ